MIHPGNVEVLRYSILEDYRDRYTKRVPFEVLSKMRDREVHHAIVDTLMASDLVEYVVHENYRAHGYLHEWTLKVVRPGVPLGQPYRAPRKATWKGTLKDLRGLLKAAWREAWTFR